MGKFIGYTLGLECFVEGQPGIKSVKIEYSEEGDQIKLQAVSGHNLERFGRKFGAEFGTKISRAAYDNRPADPYDDVAEAVWALAQVGLAPAALGA